MIFAAAKSARVMFVMAGALAVLAGTGSVVHGQVVSAAEDPSLAAAAMAVASLPTTEPAAPGAASQTDSRDGRDDHDDRRGFHPGWFGGWGGGMGGGMGGGTSEVQDIPDAGEWKQISTFLIDHSPRRWAFYQRLPEGNRQHVMMIVATKAYRNLQKAQTDDPKLAGLIVQSIEAQDAVFGTALDIRQAHREGDTGKVQSLMHTLHEKVATLVDVGLKERQLRVDGLQKSLEDLKTHLASDQKNRDSVIDDRMRSVLGGAHVPPPTGGTSDAGNGVGTPTDPAPAVSTVINPTN